MSEHRKPRNIRMTDEEWSGFKRHIGTTKLRKQINEAILRDEFLKELKEGRLNGADGK